MENDSYDRTVNNGSSQGLQRPESVVNRRPHATFSMAGPNVYAGPIEKTPSFGFEQYGERPPPNWGVARPFTNVKRRNSKNVSGRDSRQDNMRNGGGYPQPAVVPQTSQANYRHSEDNEAGHASGWGDESDEKRLTAEDLDEDGEEIQIPNFWFGIRRKIREPLAEYVPFTK